MSTKLAVITDLHLPDVPGFPQDAVLSWTMEAISTERPDVVICEGDVTAAGVVRCSEQGHDASNPFCCVLASDLFLPESWASDRARCRAAGIPDELEHRPKWQIALDQLAHTIKNGVRFEQVTFDEDYGQVSTFVVRIGPLGTMGDRGSAKELPVLADIAGLPVRTAAVCGQACGQRLPL